MADLDTPRVSKIMKEADERLELFYSYYGDSDGSKKVKKGEKKKCQVLYCNKFVPTGSTSKCCTFHQKKKNGVTNVKAPTLAEKMSPAPKVNGTPKIINRVGHVESNLSKQVDFKGLNARDIVAKVYGLIGEQIKISLKSKATILRHAMDLFTKRGYNVICDEESLKKTTTKTSTKKTPARVFIKKALVEGDRHKVPCPKCDAITPGTLKSADYNYGGKTIPNILQLFCDDCGSYAGMPYQSNAEVKKYLDSPIIQTKEINLTGLSAKDIVKKVKEILSQEITISVKSKKHILKCAIKLFNNAGYKTII